MAIRKNLSKHLSGLPNVVSLLFNSDSYCLSQRHSGLSPISPFPSTVPYFLLKPWSVPYFPLLKSAPFWSVPYFPLKTVVCPLFPHCLSQRHSGLSHIFVKTVVCPLFPGLSPISYIFVKTVVCPLFPFYFLYFCENRGLSPISLISFCENRGLSPISYILFSHATFSSKNVALGF